MAMKKSLITNYRKVPVHSVHVRVHLIHHEVVDERPVNLNYRKRKRDDCPDQEAYRIWYGSCDHKKTSPKRNCMYIILIIDNKGHYIFKLKL